MMHDNHWFFQIVVHNRSSVTVLWYEVYIRQMLCSEGKEIVTYWQFFIYILICLENKTNENWLLSTTSNSKRITVTAKHISLGCPCKNNDGGRMNKFKFEQAQLTFFVCHQPTTKLHQSIHSSDQRWKSKGVIINPMYADIQLCTICLHTLTMNYICVWGEYGV